MGIFITTVNATAGTAEQASTLSLEFRYFVAQARPSNGSAVYVGDSAVTSTNGFELAPGDKFTYNGVDSRDVVVISEFYFDAATGTDNIDVFAFNA